MAELKKILYVEDETDIQTIARMALEMMGGFTVAVCSTGREALEAVFQFKPDLVMLDVMMPEMDGPETLKALRRLAGGETIPVIFMTAKVQAHETAEYRKLGAVGVIAKPFDPMTLAAQVQEIWNRVGR